MHPAPGLAQGQRADGLTQRIDLEVDVGVGGGPLYLAQQRGITLAQRKAAFAPGSLDIGDGRELRQHLVDQAGLAKDGGGEAPAVEAGKRGVAEGVDAQRQQARHLGGGRRARRDARCGDAPQPLGGAGRDVKHEVGAGIAKAAQRISQQPQRQRVRPGAQDSFGQHAALVRMGDNACPRA